MPLSVPAVTTPVDGLTLAIYVAPPDHVPPAIGSESVMVPPAIPVPAAAMPAVLPLIGAGTPTLTLNVAIAEHPEVVLHYSNSDGVSKQVISLSDEEGIKFEVPSGKYSKLFLAFTSVRGASHMKVDLQYADGVESKTFELRDCYADLPASDSNSCYLAHNLAKWDKANHMQEKDHHNIDLLNVQPDPKRNLIQIQITKTKEITQLTLWAATAVIAK